MPFFLGGKSRGAFGQMAFFLAGNRMTTVAKEDFFLRKRLFKSLLSNTIQFDRSGVKNLRKISNIYKWKEKVQSNTLVTFWWKAKSSSYENYLGGFRLCCVLLQTQSAHRLSL